MQTTTSKTMQTTTTAINRVLGEAWAITQEQLALICGIADRSMREDPVALSARLGRPLGNRQHATVLNGVARIPLEGPLFAKANAMTEHSGATSYEVVARDLSDALDDPSIEAIVLDIDSPGGQVQGASELAQLVYASRERKPIVAYVRGLAASAAYWVASAASKIYLADTAQVGSIGVVIGTRAKQDDEGSYRFISSQTPNKQRGPDTDEGASAMQRNADALADVFIEAVAKHRSTPRSIVQTEFGQGDVFVGAEALRRGMVDELTTLEALQDRLQKNAREKMDWTEITSQALAEHRPDIVAELQAGIACQAIATERERISEIASITKGLGLDAEAVASLVDGGATAIEVREYAFEVLAERARTEAPAPAPAPAPDAAARHAEHLARTESNLDAPNASAGEVASSSPEQDEIAAILRVAKRTGAVKENG